MALIVCPNCKNELNDFEINKLWCTNCNTKFKHINDLYDNNPELKLQSEKEYLKYHNFLVTTGNQFEGYIIDKYFNLVNGEVVMGTGFLSEFSAHINDFLGTTSNTLENKMQVAKELATKKVINSAIEIGANAAIGFKYDLFSLTDNIISVSAYATAVHINKINDNE